MPRGQRWSTWLVMACCLTSGLGYWIVLDFIEIDPAPVKVWWIAHGISSLIALPALGAALVLHVRIAWRARRGTVTGVANLVAMAMLAATAIALFYGLPAWRDSARTIHVLVGAVAFGLFPLHVLWGRKQPGRSTSIDAIASDPDADDRPQPPD